MAYVPNFTRGVLRPGDFLRLSFNCMCNNLKYQRLEDTLDSPASYNRTDHPSLTPLSAKIPRSCGCSRTCKCSKNPVCQGLIPGKGCTCKECNQRVTCTCVRETPEGRTTVGWKNGALYRCMDRNGGALSSEDLEEGAEVDCFGERSREWNMVCAFCVGLTYEKLLAAEPGTDIATGTSIEGLEWSPAPFSAKEREVRKALGDAVPEGWNHWPDGREVSDDEMICDGDLRLQKIWGVVFIPEHDVSALGSTWFDESTGLEYEINGWPRGGTGVRLMGHRYTEKNVDLFEYVYPGGGSRERGLELATRYPARN